MKRNFSLVLAILFTIFTLPVNGLTVMAEDKNYDDLADGTYEITAKAMNATEDEASLAAGFIDEEVELSIKDGKAELIISIPESPGVDMEGIQVEKQEPKVKEEDGVKYFTYKLDNLKRELNSRVQYKVDLPGLEFDHDVPLRFILEGLDELPVEKVETKTETEEIEFETVNEEDSSLEKGQEEVKQEGVNGTKKTTYEVTYTDGEETGRKPKGEPIIKEPINKIILIGTKEPKPEKEKKAGKYDDIADGTYDITAKAMNATEDEASLAAGFIDEEVELSIKDGKTELTISIPETPGVDMESIQVEKQEPKVKEEDGIKYFTYKLDNLKRELNSRVQYKVDLPGLNFDHDVPLRFILEGLDELPLKEDDLVIKVKPETKTEEIKFETVKKDDPSLEKGKTKMKQKGINGTKKVMYEVTYTDGKKTKREVKKELVTKKPVNKIILVGTKATKEPKNNKLTPDRAFGIDYTIKHEDGIKDSVANEFFTNKGILLDKGGLTYLQMTITSGDMVKDLKGKYGEAIVVKRNADGSIVVQLRVDDLSDMPLDMHVIVPEGAIPGFPGYDEDHKALLIFDKNSRQEIEVGNHMLGALVDNENGPEVTKEESTSTAFGNGNGGSGDNGNGTNGDGDGNDTPGKPEFGATDKDGSPISNDKSNNPQTGDLTNIWLYTFLLAGSLLILGVKFRRRTI